MGKKRLLGVSQVLSRPALPWRPRKGFADAYGSGNFAKVAAVLGRQMIPPLRGSQLPGRNAWAKNLEELFEECSASPCLLNVLLTHHSCNLRVSVAFLGQGRVPEARMWVRTVASMWDLPCRRATVAFPGHGALCPSMLVTAGYVRVFAVAPMAAVIIM